MYNEKNKLMRNSLSYSIWIVPDNGIKIQLYKKIQLLASKFDAPLFDPHITLLGGFLGDKKTLLNKTKIISKKIKPFKIFFEDVAYLNEFFRSLFLRVNNSPHLNSAKNKFSTKLKWEEKDYVPHLSLIYGNYSIEQKKK